jgi:hypothetical protein
MLFVPVFAWPPLFQIRSDLKPLHHFKTFSDKRGENFSLVCENEGSRVIPELVDRGYRQFAINNLGHLSLLRDFRPELRLIAGPWLYTFNAWALSYIVSLGIDGVISPLENNRQNLERSIGMGKTGCRDPWYLFRFLPGRPFFKFVQI